MKWFDDIKNTDDVVISSRVRLARNLKDFAFTSRLDKDSSKKVCLSIKQALEVNYPEKLTFSEMNNNKEMPTLVEEHIISPDFCTRTDLCRFLATDDSNNLSIMINEEDHIRIQAIFSGLNLESAFEKANEADDAIIKGTEVAFSEKYGFLTSCPTNLGTGMRCSCMLHLPALTHVGYMKSIIGLMNKIGLTVRGIYGEGSEAKGNMYQISNRVTLGINEKDTLEKLKGAVVQIVEKEREMRKKLFESGSGEYLDILWRSYGTLKYARKIDTAESTKLISNLLLASTTGVISECRDKNLVKLLFEIMPSHIQARFPDATTPSLRDKYRAGVIREYLQ